MTTTSTQRRYEVPEALFAILFIPGAIAGPTLSAFVVTNALEGKEGDEN